MPTPPHQNAHPAADTDQALRAGCTVRFQRRSGPGGQHRNKVSTAVFLTHRETGITASASERRSQAENFKQALRRLRLNLAIQQRTPWRQPSHLWKRRCHGRRIVVNPRHADFPVMLAEALDALQAVDWQVRTAAEQLTCSPTQLMRFLALEPRAKQLLDDHLLKRRSETGQTTPDPPDSRDSPDSA